MKLNKKETILLIILLMLVTCFGFYKYVYLRNIKQLEDLYTEYNEKNQQFTKMHDKIKIKNYYSLEYKKSNYVVNELTEQFLPKLEQEKVIVFIDKYLNKHNIKATSIGFTDVEFEVIAKNNNESNNDDYLLDDLKQILEEYKIDSTDTSETNENKSDLLNDLKNDFENSKDSNLNTDEENIEQASVESMGLNISFASTYLDLLEFIGSLQNNPINISISIINISKNENNSVEGSMQLKFYAVPKLYEQENKEWVWSDLMEYGKSNPFYNDIEFNSDFSESKYDFKINVEAFNKNLPTVSISHYNDNLGKTFIYADSNDVEKVFIEFKEVNDNIYYRYYTQMDSYPKDDKWERFVPENGYISFKIYSSARVSKEDKSEINVNIENNTSYAIHVDIIGDDSNNPRITFENNENIIISND